MLAYGGLPMTTDGTTHGAVTECPQGLRVIDQTGHGRAVCNMLLGDMGAGVLKIDPPEVAHTRRPEECIAPGVSASFLAVNRNKRGITADLKPGASPSPGSTRRRRTSSNYRPGVARRLGVDY